MTGTVYTVPPIPPDAEHTTYVDAGALRFGVEYRLLDDAALEANYQGEAKDEIDAAVGNDDIEDNGVSIHVFGQADDHEYLRFDLFEREPHYHYIDVSNESQTIIDFDRVAHGDMLPWTLGQLRGRLVEMLTHAGGAALVPKLDAARVEASLAEVEKLALAAQSELAASARA
jgi:hypothetical protein